MSQPTISIIGPAARPKLWLNFYEKLQCNKTPFEIVFAGPNKPDFELPDNFRFIQSYVKPQQCTEIASRAALGEYILTTADDFIYSAYALDRLYAEILKANNDLAISSAIYPKHQARDSIRRFIPDDSGSPLMPYFGGMVKRSVWRKLGGIDNRFICAHGETDLTLRIIAVGGFVVYASDVFVDEIVKGGKRLWPIYGKKFDHPHLMRLWTGGWGLKRWGVYRKFSKVRRDKVRPFVDNGILNESQGFVGTWHGK